MGVSNSTTAVLNGCSQHRLCLQHFCIRGQVEREARQVRVDSLRQADPALPLPLLGLELECGGGFYVRTLIEDLGRALGTRAHMTALERTKQGPFELQHALRLEEWEYDRLCKHLGDAPGILDRLGAMTGRGTEDSSAAVTERAATAVEG
ncbi:tRNA pseudouridine synthase B [Ectocarpus siliculosus]|uniref:tRNA pseudouridine synthase B n=1 Tax=Ectocarpus siliculosus TaxID=2880 RepID=D7FWF1_ECTSI|nr:tRNA pseudouridine synthase B [Ectocarpus siliculosus]|eukprot:CBJ32039.1 tRNA pseudouridine synthase B [Ectocarpus siliculosus]